MTFSGLWWMDISDCTVPLPLYRTVVVADLIFEVRFIRTPKFNTTVLVLCLSTKQIVFSKQQRKHYVILPGETSIVSR